MKFSIISEYDGSKVVRTLEVDGKVIQRFDLENIDISLKQEEIGELSMERAEAKRNLGKEVKYVGNCEVVADSFKTYNFVIHGFSCIVDEHVSVQCNAVPSQHWNLNVKDIELKEVKKEMVSYKIKVGNEAESKEVQGLFFELGYFWHKAGKEVLHLGGKYVFTDKDGKITRVTRKDTFVESKKQKITLLQLRDLVILHRNDVSDATHKHKNIESEKYYKTCDGNFFYFSETGHWNYVGDTANDVASKHVVPIDQEQPQMKWQDALRAMADGKEVEGASGKMWVNLKKATIECIKEVKYFRLAPQRITLNDTYTKEDLLKIAGEMA